MDMQDHVGLSAGPARLSHQTARRPLNRLTTRTTRATTSSRWIRPPATCRLKPSSHRTRRITKIVQSMFSLLLASQLQAAHCGGIMRLRVRCGLRRSVLADELGAQLRSQDFRLGLVGTRWYLSAIIPLE